MQNREEAKRELDKAKIALITRKDSAFITSILFSLKFEWTSNIPTACTDGLCLKVNPTFFLSLSKEARKSLLAHEAWHVALDHMSRLGIREPVRFNKAGDYVINQILKDANFEIPDTWLLDSKYKENSTEEIYNSLPEESEENKQNYDNDVDYSDTSEETKSKITNTIIKAHTQAKLANETDEIPSEIKRLIDHLVNPVLPWTTILQNYINSFINEEYSWKKPNKRFFPEYHLPSLYSKGMNKITFAIDTSGSVKDSEFTAFLSEMTFIREKLKPKETVILDFDSKVQHEYILTLDTPLDDITFTGYGGTNLIPLFDHIKRSGDTELLIVFSDLYCRSIIEKPDYDVIWVIVNHPKAKINFGKAIHLSI